MLSRRLRVGQGALVCVFAASLLLGSGCSSSDSNANFSDVGGNGPGVGATASGGTDEQASSGKGAEQSGGSSAAGSSTQAGSATGGTQSSAGTDSGGSDPSGGGGSNAGSSNGGSSNAGSSNAGSSNAGSSNGGSAGSSNAGSSNGGSAGASGAAGAAGSAGTGGSAGNGGAGGSAGSAGTSGSAGSGGSGGCSPKAEVCDGVDNNCDNVIDPPGTCPDGCSGALYGGHTYYFCGTVDTASAAAAKCTNADMVMISIETKGENDFVAGKIKGNTWIGGSDEAQEGHWLWSSSDSLFWDNGPVDGKYANWLALQPNDNGANGSHENCLVIIPGGAIGGVNGGRWNDVNCGLTGSRWACESTGPVITPGGP